MPAQRQQQKVIMTWSCVADILLMVHAVLATAGGQKVAAWLVGVVISLGLVEVARARSDKDKGTPEEAVASE